MDTWGSALLRYYLLATRYAHSMMKPCIAYSVDAGAYTPVFSEIMIILLYLSFIQ